MNPNNYHIVPCCFYCNSCVHRERAGGDCREHDGPVQTGGVCDDFTWAVDNEWRLPKEVRPPEAQRTIDAYNEGAEERERQKEEARAAKKKQNQNEKILRNCPIARTGVPNNPCRSCDKREYCDVGRKAKV